MADEYNRLAMYASPVAPVENRLMQATLPPGHPSNMLMWLRDQIPQVQADDSSTMSGITSRLGRTATAIPRAGLETMSNWLRGTHDPNAVRIGEDTIAPLGLMGMAGLAGRGVSAAAMADNARSSVPGTVVNAMGEQPQTIRAYHGSPYARPDGKLDASKINPDEPGFFFSNDPWLSSQYVKHGLAPMDVINGAFDESLARGYMELLPDGRSRVVDRAAHDKLVREIEGSWLPNGANVTPVDIDPSKLRTIDLPGYRWDQDEGAKIAEAARAAKAEGYAGLNIRGMREGRDTRPMPDSQRPDVQTIWEPGHVKSATTGDTIFASPSSSPGLAASASQQDDNPVLSILSKYGLY